MTIIILLTLSARPATHAYEKFTGKDATEARRQFEAKYPWYKPELMYWCGPNWTLYVPMDVVRGRA